MKTMQTIANTCNTHANKWKYIETNVNKYKNIQHTANK